MMRVDKLLSNMGYGTRKQIKKSVKEGEVLVNGQPIKDPGTKVDSKKDVVIFAGEEVIYREFIYLMLNKSKGYVSSTDDPQYPTILELIDPYYYNFDPYPVGRLDVDTTGLLVITNDGMLTHQLTNPKKGVVKWYEALIEGEVTEKEVEIFKEGVSIPSEGYIAKPAELEIIESGSTSFIRVGISEGKYHQVKHMFREVGMKVLELKRISMGKLRLDESLEEGEFRELTEEEVNLLKES